MNTQTLHDEAESRSVTPEIHKWQTLAGEPSNKRSKTFVAPFSVNVPFATCGQ